ncbi:MAG: hypothetical protein LBI99_06180, partial [Propionibacteriaceae bacterium]|nr:hypothetical protein [Propionibacteriaceae bacterium]
MTEILALTSTWPLFAVALTFGLLPGVVTRVLALGFRKDDPRRQEMIAAVYAVPRWERPFWVLQQVECVFREGILERLLDAAGGRLFNWWVLGDWVAMHLAHPNTFEIPTVDEIALLRPGGSVKLMFDPKGRLVTKRLHPERIWVDITEVDTG